MKYSEFFHTIQGEGKLVGVPSVFFRTSYCNLRCGWCDSAYTSWNPENKDITLAEAVEAITKYDCKHVVITGGEPFIQVKELTQLCQELDRRGHHITIETNATIFAPVAAHFISMSPKLRNSNPPSDNRFFKGMSVDVFDPMLSGNFLVGTSAKSSLSLTNRRISKRSRHYKQKSPSPQKQLC